MHGFSRLLVALGPPWGGPWRIDGEVALAVRYDHAREALVLALHAGARLTIHRRAWDGAVTIVDPRGQITTVGPRVVYVTFGVERWFRQRDEGAWRWVGGHGAPDERLARTIDAMMRAIEPCLQSSGRT